MGASTSVIIPARAGSKGIPLKNLQLIGKYSLLEHTIADAYELRCPIYVTTEDDRTGFMAQEADAVYMKRPKELAQDESTTEEAVIDVLKRIDAKPDDIVVLMQCTSPFRKPGELVEALEFFKENELDCLFSCYELYPYAWDDEGNRVVYDYKAKRTNRQDKFPLWIEDGSFYISRAWCYYKHGNRFAGSITRWYHDKIYGLEIDTQEDLECAKILYPWLKKSGKV